MKLDSAFLVTTEAALTFFPVKEASTRLTTSPLPQQACREEVLSGRHFVAAHPSPPFEGIYWVCRPSFAFTHATPRAQCSFSYCGKGEKTDTARRASGDSTTSCQINWAIIPLNEEE